MRNPIFMSTAAGFLGAALVMQAIPARAGEPVDRPLEAYFAFCRSDDMIGNAFYFSATRHIDAGVGRQDLQKSFRDLLARKYKYPNTKGVSCAFAVGSDLQARTESSRQETINNLRSAHYDVVEINWTYAK